MLRAVRKRVDNIQEQMRNISIRMETLRNLREILEIKKKGNRNRECP